MSPFRYAARALLHSPGFTVVAVLSLALGIGANTAIFSLIDAVMLRALPVEEPQELARVTFGDAGDAQLTNPLWEELSARQDVFSGAFAYAGERFDLANGGESRPVEGSWVSGEFFSTLGVRPAAGRLLGAGDDTPGCPATAVLGHGFWQNEYGGDRSVVGRAISLNGHPFQIVGVAPAGFFGFEVGGAAQVYAPLCARAVVMPPTGGLDNRSFWFLRVGGRLRDGVGIEDARGRLAALAPSIYAATIPIDWNTEMRQGYLDNSLGAEPAANGYSELRNGYDSALTALMAVVGLVLLIACANVANLLLARGAVRGRELAIRMAIGAGRARLVRQLLAESLLLSLLGAAAGLFFAGWASELLVNMLASGANPISLDVSLNPRVLAFTTLVALATTIVFGLIPAWRATRVHPQSAMKASDRTIAPGQTRFNAGKALVVAQITLSLVLVVVAGLLLGSFRRLANVELGFVDDGVLVASLDLRKAGYGEEELAGAKREILERLREAPGVVEASASDIVPMSGAAWNGLITVDGFQPQTDRDAMVYFNAVAGAYFATTETALLAGREFDEGDRAESAPVAVISETLARKFFAGRNPVGERIGLAAPGEREAETYLEVVGVVDDTKYRSLREEPVALLYRPLSQTGGGSTLNVVLRGSTGPETLMPTVEAISAQLNPRISITYSVLSERIEASLVGERTLATLAGFFGGLAVLLTVVGLYGTIAYSVARRRNEIGVRMALGAERRDLLRMVLGEVGRLAGLGLLLGALATLATARLVTSFLYGLSPHDPMTLTLSGALLALAALAAGAVPAWRAAGMDPMAALREE